MICSQIEILGDVPPTKVGASSCVVDGCLFIFGGRSKEAKKSWDKDSAITYSNDIFVFNPGNSSTFFSSWIDWFTN